VKHSGHCSAWLSFRAWRRGHPIAIPGRFRDALAAADAGTLKDALLALGVRLLEVPVDDEGVVRDVDVPADLKS